MQGLVQYGEFFCGQNFEREYINVLLNKLLLCVNSSYRGLLLMRSEAHEL